MSENREGHDSLTRIGVYSGHVIDPINPDPNDIYIEDIAHALSNQCRFSGHVTRFYSVAEHSITCSAIVDEGQEFGALMHDASEAYLVDVPSPLKNALFGEAYREVEGKLMKAIGERFGFDPTMTSEIKRADNVMLCTEARDLLGARPDDDLWGPWLLEGALPQRITVTMSPETAESTFLKLFEEYKEN